MSSRLNILKMPGFQGSIDTGNTIQVYLDGGPTYEQLMLLTSNVTAAKIAEFSIEVEGQVRVKMTGQQMLDREAYDGKEATSGQFVFSFADLLARTIQGEASGALVTKPGERILVKIILGTIAGGETFDLYAITSPNRRREANLFCIPENVPVTTTGDNDFPNFRRGDYAGHIRIRRVFNYGNITHLRIEQDDRFPFGKEKLLKAVNDAELLRNGKTVPASCYVFDPTHRGNSILDAFDTFSVRSMKATFTTGDSNDITALTEYLEIVGNEAA